MKHFFCLITLIVALAQPVLAAPQAKGTKASDATALKPQQQRIAATINGEVLTKARLDELYERMGGEMRAKYDRAGGKKAFLDNYVGKRLLIQEALKSGFDKKPEIQQDMQAARDAVLFDRYVREVVAPSILDEKEVRAFYVEHKNEFKKDERVRARHIIASSDPGAVMNTTGDDARTKEEALAKITRLAQQINTGALSFQAAAIQYSEDASAAKGGDLGWFTRGMMVGPFEDAAFSLAKGKVSHVVETQFGYHLILIEDRQEAAPAPFEEVRADIKEQLLALKANEILAAVNRLTQELRSQSQIQVFAENLE